MELIGFCWSKKPRSRLSVNESLITLLYYRIRYSTIFGIVRRKVSVCKRRLIMYIRHKTMSLREEERERHTHTQTHT